MNNVPLIYQWFLRRIHASAFLSGIVFSLVLFMLMGRLISSRNIYASSFQRFHHFLTPETLFYPTASQLLSLAQSRFQADKDRKIAVIIGGSSVFNGVGQSTSKLWSSQLQALLGQEYQVLNLAMRAGGPAEAGAITAQGLLKRGYHRLIYILDVSPGESSPPDGYSIHKYLFWDAYYKDLLLKDPSRDSYLHTVSFNADDMEMHRLARLDSLFYFNDLWTSLGYLSLFTVWNSIIAGQSPQDGLHWLGARRLVADDNYEPSSMAQRYRPELFAHEMEIVKDQCIAAFKLDLNKLEMDLGFWRSLTQQAKIMLPDPLKQRSLVVVRYDSPYYRQHLPRLEQQCWHQAVKETIHRYQELGYFAANFDKDFNSLDYSDRVHLAPSGGFKLATRIASEVEKIAQKLGYTTLDQSHSIQTGYHKHQER
jgi:hypothetical protein